MSKGKTLGPWRITDEREIFDNPWINLADHKVIHPDGTPGEYGVVRFKNLAVGVLPIDAEGKATLVGQHRFPLDKYSWELPEGGGKRDVPPLDSAKRELEEETGLRAREWERLCEFDISNSVTDERAVCYLAWDLSEGEAAPDPSEALTIKQVFFKDLLEMVMSGEITDSLTIVMVMTAYIKALHGALPEPISTLILAGLPQK
ncbi:NUDIX domain-containing protein [Hyphococcus luteus]|uniref:GDP-mannose pyrophosphatase n=1 Tax=Hyphococcus luteus TaxID=2058213 RepID=A0A2S7K3U8_9PROT|nr:NUDIX hydrolase [Marinicaulis flavus]PQA87118.1 DNA mismatch repair protein MutT [Marinicaulis flavus]